jgi:uncharacterized Ntn-hydrolase superfamily protein
LTLTIIARDATGALGIAQATCPPCVGARCPLIRPGVGAVSSQGFTNPTLRTTVLDYLLGGSSPQEAINQAADGDRHFESRQLGVIDQRGRAAVHTGSQTKGCRGHVLTAECVVMGNDLATDGVIDAMAKAFTDSRSRLLEDRMLAAVVSGRDAGGDSGGHNSAVLLAFGDKPYARTDLRVDWSPGSPDAVDALVALGDFWRPLIPYYMERPQNPDMVGWKDWLQDARE